MGAGIDAYAQAAKMGVGPNATMSYNQNSPVATASAFQASAENTMAFAAGRSANTQYSMSQRYAAGDAHADRVFSAAPLDLTVRKVAAKTVYDDFHL